MLTGEALTEHLTKEFTRPQAIILSKVITDSYQDLVKTSDFNELKEIVRDLGEAQKRTEATMDRLGVRMDELAAAQNRTEATVDRLGVRMDELTKAQNRTEQRMNEMVDAHNTLELAMASLATTVERTHAELTDSMNQMRIELTNGLNAVRSEVGGLSKSFGYSLENEAYRLVPGYLQEHHGIVTTERFIRRFVRDREINLLAEGEQNGEPILIVGESKAQLGTDDFVQLQENIEAVQQAQAAGELPNYRIVPLLLTHMARPQALRRAEQEGVIVVQSFEW